MGKQNHAQKNGRLILMSIWRILQFHWLKVQNPSDWLESLQSYIPVDTERKLNAHKTFRRRPERLLNVLCTFNLLPVFTGLTVLFKGKDTLWNISFTVFYVDFTVYLIINFQLICFSMLSLNISVKEIFGFQKLKISFSEILFQKKTPHASLVLLFQLRNREEVICRNEICVLWWIVKINIWWSNQCMLYK